MIEDEITLLREFFHNMSEDIRQLMQDLTDK